MHDCICDTSVQNGGCRKSDIFSSLHRSIDRSLNIIKLQTICHCQYDNYLLIYPSPLIRRIFVIVLLAYFNGTRSSVILSRFHSTWQTVRALKHVGSLDKAITSVLDFG